MAKHIYCSKCGKHLGELVKGSKILRGTEYLCSGCYSELESKSFDFGDLLRNISNLGGKK